MNARLFVLCAAMFAGAVSAFAQKGNWVYPNSALTNSTAEPAPVYQYPPAADMPQTPPPVGPVYVYEQKPMGGRQELMTGERADAIINQFKAAYPKLGSPRFVITVNRELVNEHSAMKLTGRTEHVEAQRNLNGAADGTVKTINQNTYVSTGKAEPTLADKQTMRDVERLFGRPLRAASASLADQNTARQLLADKPISELAGSTDSPESRKDREALSQIADAVIEILISSKNVDVPTIAGSTSITTPDIQVTAISLKDSKILGQASSAEVTGRVPPSVLASYDVREITEATALALMEDMSK